MTKVYYVAGIIWSDLKAYVSDMMYTTNREKQSKIGIQYFLEKRLQFVSVCLL